MIQSIRIVITMILPAAVLILPTWIHESAVAGEEHQSHNLREYSDPGDDVYKVNGAHNEHSGSLQPSHAGESRIVHLTQGQLRRLELQVAPAGSGSASAVVRAPATVHFDADRVALVGPLLESKVVEVTSDLGKPVQSGETLAILDSVALGRAKAHYLTATARLESAETEFRRDQKLSEQEIASEAELVESRAEYIEASALREAARSELRLYGLDDSDIDAISVRGEQPLSRYELTAPIAGTLQRRDLVPGQTLSKQETPIHIINNERMWVMIEAFEQDLPRLTAGQPIELSLRALPNQVFKGNTDWVSRELDERARTVRVRAIVTNNDNALHAGMFGTARILTGSDQQFAMVPVDSIQTIKDEEIVFVPGHEAGAYRAVTVQTGEESNGLIEVIRGIDPGDDVVIAGAFDLKSVLTSGGRSAAHHH